MLINWKTYPWSSSFLQIQVRRSKCSCSHRQYMFHCSHMGWDNSHQYLMRKKKLLEPVYASIVITLWDHSHHFPKWRAITRIAPLDFKCLLLCLENAPLTDQTLTLTPLTDQKKNNKKNRSNAIKTIFNVPDW